MSDAMRIPDPLHDEHLIKQCRVLLEMAEQGSLRAIMVVGVGMDGDSLGGIFRQPSRPDRMRMLGELACLQQRLLDEVRSMNGGEC